MPTPLDQLHPKPVSELPIRTLTDLGGLERFVLHDPDAPLGTKTSTVPLNTLAQYLGLTVPAADAHYTHTQNVPALVWVVTHNLGKRPAVSVVDSAGTEWIAEIRHLDDNTLEVINGFEFSGKAHCN